MIVIKNLYKKESQVYWQTISKPVVYYRRTIDVILQ